MTNWIKGKKFECLNCQTRVTQKWVAGFLRLGFETQHLACPECGEQTIKEQEESAGKENN